VRTRSRLAPHTDQRHPVCRDFRPQQFISVSPTSPMQGLDNGKLVSIMRSRFNSLLSIRNSRWPQRGGAWGMRRGQRRADHPLGEIGVSPQLRERQCRALVGRLIDALDGDASGVSALQHSARSVIPLRGATERSESGTVTLGQGQGQNPIYPESRTPDGRSVKTRS
jgi:hypothetical protein